MNSDPELHRASKVERWDGKPVSVVPWLCDKGTGH